MIRPPCCDKMNIKRGLWTAEEDAKILAYVSKHGTGNWTVVPKKAGLKRCGKSCRLRWTNYLRPDLKHDSFTPQEEEMIVRLHSAIGSRWSIIAQQLPGRTDNDVKNYWNTKLRKKLSEMGIDPVTHKPFSQILADYGNIGGLRKHGSRIGSLNKDLKNAIIMKSEPYSVQSQGFPNMISSQLMMPATISSPQDSYLNSNIYSNNHSLDLLAELQAIRMVTDPSNCSNIETTQPSMFGEASLSCSSSSSSSSSPPSTSSAAAQEKSPLGFSWRDFLLDDAFPPADPQEREMATEFSSKDFNGQPQNMIPQRESTNNEAATQEMDYAVLSNDISFVEAMIGQENDMFLDFPDLLEEPFYF